MLFHASPVKNIKTLTPRISNHGKPLIYFSSKPENTLVYLSNAVEKCCKENGFDHKGIYAKWGSYGFNKEGILTLDEYWSNAAYDTYKGVSGYIYRAEETACAVPFGEIPFAFISENPVEVKDCVFVPDAYEAIQEAAREGKIILTEYKDNSPKKLEWIEKTVKEEYETAKAENKEEYIFFLKRKFEFL